PPPPGARKRQVMLSKRGRRVIAVLFAVPWMLSHVAEQIQAQVPSRPGLYTPPRGRPGIPHPAQLPLGVHPNPLLVHINPPPQPRVTAWQQQALQQQQFTWQQQQAYLNALQQQTTMLTPVQLQMIMQYQQLIALQQQNAVLTLLQQQQMAALNLQVALWMQQQQQQIAAAQQKINNANGQNNK